MGVPNYCCRTETKNKSPGKIRVCVDMRIANEAIKRECHITPTIKEIVGDLNGATVFSKLDLNQGSYTN